MWLCLCVYKDRFLMPQGQATFLWKRDDITFYWMSDFFDSSAQLNLLLERSMPLLKIVAVHLTCFFYAVLLSTIENKSSYHAGLSFKIMKQLQTQKDDVKIKLVAHNESVYLSLLHFAIHLCVLVKLMRGSGFQYVQDGESTMASYWHWNNQRNRKYKSGTSRI